MGSKDFFLLTLYAVGLTCGQMLFKSASGRTTSSPSAGGIERLAALVFNGSFIAAVVLYGLLSVLWVFLLRSVPISVAYPFVALSLVLTVLVGSFVFQEPLTARVGIGVALVVGGVLVLSS